jgi:peptidoglycan/xylan/chitin deacetylase (PgdA/CDA1 family)
MDALVELWDQLIKAGGATSVLGIFMILLMREVLPYLAARKAGKNGKSADSGVLAKAAMGCEARSVHELQKLTHAELAKAIAQTGEALRETTGALRAFKESFDDHVASEERTHTEIRQELVGLKTGQAVMLDRIRGRQT